MKDICKRLWKGLAKRDSLSILCIILLILLCIIPLTSNFFDKGLIIGFSSIIICYLLCPLCFWIINKITAKLSARNALLVGIDILLLGIVLSVYSITNIANIVLGIGSSVLASCIFYAFIEKRVATLLGNIDVKNIDLSLFITQIQTNKEIQVFRVMDTWTELVSEEFYENFKKAIESRQNIKLEVLVANPYSKVIEQRGEDLSKDIYSISEKGISNLYDLFKKSNQKLEIKLYDTTISVRFYSWESRAFFSVYPPKKQAENEANLEIFTDSTLGNYVIKHFEQIWGSEKSIRISHHMKICLNPSSNRGWENDKEVFYCIDITQRDIYIVVPIKKQRELLELQESNNLPTRFLIDQVFLTELFSDMQFNKLHKNIDVKEGYVAICGVFIKLDQDKVIELFTRRYGTNNDELKSHFNDPTFFKVNINKINICTSNT